MSGDTKKWIAVLIALAMAAPILTAIFSTGGPFAMFQGLAGGEIIDPVTGATSDSALEGNNYLPIIGAAVALIPVGLLGVFLFKFINGNVGNAKRRNKRSAFRR